MNFLNPEPRTLSPPLNRNEFARIAVFRGGALGDFILTLPAIRAVRRRWPQATLELFAYTRAAALAVMAGLANKTHALDAAEMSQLFGRKLAAASRTAKHLSTFDLVVSYLHDPDQWVEHNLRKHCAGRVICASPLVQSGHAVDHFLRPLADLNLPFEPDQIPVLNLPGAFRLQGRTMLQQAGVTGPAIVIHPGSGNVKKNWPPEKFAALALDLGGADMGRPVFLLGEAEAGLAALAPGVPVFKDLTLPAAAAIIRASRGYIGNDSGITHLAAALGVPTVALFGPTDPAVWGPRGARVISIKSAEPSTAGLAKISIEEVEQAIVKISGA